jgi:hypothetical protein
MKEKMPKFMFLQYVDESSAPRPGTPEMHAEVEAYGKLFQDVSGAGIPNRTMTPYDVTIVRLRDGLDLFGMPPVDVARYLDALRSSPGSTVAALAADGTLVTADGLGPLVQVLLHRPWDEAEAQAKAAGALIGAYPVA